MRLIHVDSLPDGKPVITLACDSDGLQHHAVRLKIAHLKEGRQTKEKHLRIALLAAAGEGTAADLAHAKISSEVHGQDWIVKAAVGGTALELTRGAGDRKAITSTSVNGEQVSPKPLAVDGKEVSIGR